ncbi:hypothetical protein CWM47_13865 [Spirosoma pollinicola]|uniref:GLPGLI family protein n=2 Tax=Spirosoma pollinicola TaxID=2057025 RepID=A0A2K8YZ22_9BACT|nr:hypothetical protein [Spirosoma pollinicola]AUD02824.1 hypothetical protein CWM47_13865 [Spirosoma pollinicola]
MNQLSRKLRFVLMVSFLCAAAYELQAQSKSPQKTYMYLIYHKLNPGLTIQDALPVEREWKKVNQAAVDEGKLEGWYMTVKQFTSNLNQSEYDYVTRIVTHEMAIKGASPEAMARIYGDSVQAKMADLQKRDRNTAPVVKIEIWEITDGTFAPKFAPDGTQFMIVDRIRRRTPGANYDGAVGQLKKLSEERIKRGNLLGWDFSTLVIPNGSEKGYEFSIAHYVTSLGAVANPVMADTPTPVMSAPAYKQLQSQTAQVFDVTRQEVYRFMEYTTKPAN